MSEKKKDIPIAINQVPFDGALGLFALGDTGIRAWKEVRAKVRKLKEEKEASEKNKNDGKQE